MGCSTSRNTESRVDSATGGANSTNSDNIETHCESVKDKVCACRIGQLCNCNQSAKGRRVGYEYRYRFSTAEADDIHSNYKSQAADGGVKTFLFEYRTNFFIIPIKEPPIQIDSETFACELQDGNGIDSNQRALVHRRLKDYWMSAVQCLQLESDALSFAVQHDRVSVVVDLEVCTVQQEKEALEACTDRAISAKKLAPMHLWPYGTDADPEVVEFLRGLRRERVESIDEWGWPRNQRGQRFIMGVCGVCSKGASIGDEVSELAECKHVFHSHCIFRWLEKYNMCPTCRFPAYAVEASATIWT